MDRIPILRIGEFLLVTVQVDMHDQLALRLQEDLASMIEKTGARGVLLDISALDMVDSFIGRMIATISATARILSRHTGYDANITRAHLEACIAACRACGDECEQHAGMHEHCRICAEACRECEAACRELLAAIG